MQEVPLEGDVFEDWEKEVRPTSSLRELRYACKYLRIPHTGAKSVLWTRLQKEVALSELRDAVRASDAVIAGYDPGVRPAPLPQRPDPQTVMVHELTHLPVLTGVNIVKLRFPGKMHIKKSSPNKKFPSSPWIGCSTALGKLRAKSTL